MDKYEILWDRIWKNNDEKTIAIVELKLFWQIGIKLLFICIFICILLFCLQMQWTYNHKRLKMKKLRIRY